MKRNVLNIPVFCEPERAVGGYHTSPTQPLRSATWLRYLWWLGHTFRLKQSFTQYCAQRGLVNVVNSKLVLLPMRSSSLTTLILILKITVDKAPSSVQDQIFDHHFNVVWYYLDQKVRFNTQAAFLNHPSDDVVQKLARLMTLTVDLDAPTKLSDELSKKVANSKQVVQLSHTSKDLTKKLKKKYWFVRLAPPNDPLLKEKKEVNAALHRKKTNRRNRMLEKAQKRHFRHADTVTLKAQFADLSLAASDEDVKPPAPLQYNITEQGEIVRLTCEPIADLSNHKKHARRIEALQAQVALCGRQESRRSQPQSTQSSRKSMTTPKVPGELGRGYERPLSPGVQAYAMHLLPRWRTQILPRTDRSVRSAQQDDEWGWATPENICLGRPNPMSASQVQGQWTGSFTCYGVEESHCNGAQDLFACLGSRTQHFLSLTYCPACRRLVYMFLVWRTGGHVVCMYSCYYLCEAVPT